MIQIFLFIRCTNHAREAIKLSEGKSSEELVDDRVLGLAIVRLMEIVGEAANRVPKEEQSRHPEIPWTQIIGLRNRLIHGYDAIDYEILWNILNHDLPELVQSLERTLDMNIE
ncbi:MAG: HepT-like ribonuclease domain-containing protein [Methanotrichaceae archaeon]